jgi:beta-glucosidase
MDMQSGLFLKELPKLVKQGKVKESTIDQAVKRILKIKFELGLFKNPYKYCDPEREHRDTMTTANLKLARDMAKKSIVLLKNDHNVLPLSKNVKTIALLGPLADNKKDLLGPWHGASHWQDVQTVLNGIKEKVSRNTRILYDKGVDIKGGSTKGFSKAVRYARQADVAIVCVGESETMSGEAASRSKIGLPGKQLEFVKAIEKTGTPVVVVLMNGRPLTLPWISDNVPGILETWFLGTEAGPAISDVLFGDYNPSGKLTTTFPRDVGQIPLYYNHYNTGRPFQKNNKYTSKYLDVSNTPQYPFGYGLSYTTFKYSKPTLDKHKITTRDSVKVHITITNTGKRAGEEIAQFYISEKYADVSPRVKELKGFTHVDLKPGESRQVTFTLTPQKMSMYNLNMKKVVEPGTFEIMTGPNSADVQTDTLQVVNPQ